MVLSLLLLLPILTTPLLCDDSRTQTLISDISSKTSKKLQLNREKLSLDLVKERLPNLYIQLQEALEAAKNETSPKDVIYLFASSSVPKNSIRDFILHGSLLNYYFGTKVLIVFQGFTDQEFELRMHEVANELKQYESVELFLSNFIRIFDPYIFKELKITTAPAIGYAYSNNGDTFPTNTDMRFLARGDIPLVEFFEKIQEKDSNFKSHFQLLKNY